MKTYEKTASSDLGLPPDSYIYAFATTAAQENTKTDVYQPLTSSDRLAVISSDDSLRIIDPSSLKLVPDGLIQNVNASVTSLKRYATNGQECNLFMTTGRDGRICGWDLRSQSKALEFRSPKSEPLSMLDCDSELQAIVAGTELEGNGPGDVSIFGWDVRSPGQARMSYSESHTDTITELRFIPHAQSSSLLLSASTDGLINIFDTSTAEEDDAIFQVINHRSAIHHAGLVENEIYGLGTDETLSFYPFHSTDLEAEEPQPTKLGDVRKALECEYVVNLAYRGKKPMLSVGNHSSRWLDLIRLISNEPIDPNSVRWRFNTEKRIRLEGAHGQEIVRDVFVSEDPDVVFTCGEDGTVKQWRKLGDENVEMSGTKSSKRRREEGGSKKEKRSKGSKHERYLTEMTPYD